MDRQRGYYKAEEKIRRVNRLTIVGGESDVNARPLYYDWVLHIREQCVRADVSFEFRQCGTHFVKDGKEYKLQVKDLMKQARLAGINYQSRKGIPSYT